MAVVTGPSSLRPGTVGDEYGASRCKCTEPVFGPRSTTGLFVWTSFSDCDDDPLVGVVPVPALSVAAFFMAAMSAPALRQSQLAVRSATLSACAPRSAETVSGDAS